ncbi:MAG: hypothetical protein H7835_09770 [Magnetococcus sp. XQGC-1]
MKPSATALELPTSPTPEERLARWLSITRGMPPEQLAALTVTPRARWAVTTETGGPDHGVTLTAYLESSDDLPFWAFALAKSYLDDVGEWPLFGMATEQALDMWAEHQDSIRAVREILATVKPVWPDLEVLYVGQEKE